MFLLDYMHPTTSILYRVLNIGRTFIKTTKITSRLAVCRTSQSIRLVQYLSIVIRKRPGDNIKNMPKGRRPPPLRRGSLYTIRSSDKFINSFA